MKKRPDSLVIRDRPWGSRMFGLIFAVAGVVGAFLGNPKSPDLAVGAPLFVIGLAFLLLSSDLTLRIDRTTGRLRLTYESVLTWEIKTLKLDEIAAVDIESTTSDKGRLYRVVIVDDKGRATPLRSAYTNGYEDHAALADQLRKLTGVGGSDGKAIRLDGTNGR